MWSRRKPKGLRYALVLLASLAAGARAERLPIRVYTTADGLAQNNVERIVRDSRGLLWLCTRDGLSRFDGHSFTSYGSSEGLPHPNVNHLAETRGGDHWIATNGGGVARLRARSERPSSAAATSPRSHFEVYPVGDNSVTNRVNALYEDRAGTLWAGSDGELFRLDPAAARPSFEPVDLGLPTDHRWIVIVAFVEDREGRLWMGTSDGLLVREPSGRVLRVDVRPAQGYDWVRSLLLDREGRLWIGSLGAGLIVLDPARLRPDVEPSRFQLKGHPMVEHWYTVTDGLADSDAYALLQTDDGHVWVGGSTGLAEFDGQRFRAHGRAQGLGPGPFSSLAEDAGGSLWTGSSFGAVKIARSGFVSFDESDGLDASPVRSMLEGRDGGLVVALENGALCRFDGKRFACARPRLATEALVWPQAVLQDHLGEWWLPTLDGLFRFPSVSSVAALRLRAPAAVYTARQGLSSNTTLRAFEDRDGSLWVSAGGQDGNLARLDRARLAFVTYRETETHAPSSSKPTCFAQDRSGTLWMGLHDGGLLRYRNGLFRFLSAPEGIPAGQVNQLHLDRLGRLWMATNASGVARLEALDDELPRVTMVGMREGLPSNNVTCLAEDGLGRLYLGTGNGVGRLDPGSGRVVHHTRADGLDIGGVEAALADSHGALWFGGQHGVSRLLPQADRPRSPPPVFVTGLRVLGVAAEVSQVGETEIVGLELGPDQNQLAFDFAAPSFATGETVRYQFKLEGADREWSVAGDQRSVNYASLSPGSYVFLVRALGADGVPSLAPAAVAFRILPPFWRRWWFLASLGLALGYAVFLLHRLRVARLLEVAHMRTRIATDLHDDIGSNLTKIAIWSELARQQGAVAEASERLASIARVARESVASMSDIVWAINPDRDGLPDLVRRMRRFAEEAFGAREIALEFRAPDARPELRLGADIRRHIFLIFKESVNNAVRHSGCGRATVDFSLEQGLAVLRVADDGRGFDPARPVDGNGLASLRRRTASLGGQLEIRSSPGQGTEITLRVGLVDHPRAARPA